MSIATSRMFPIQRHHTEKHDITGIPWDCIAEHEPQMLKNHEQSLERMAQRAGLGIHEAYMVLTDTPLSEFFKYPDKFKSDVCAEGVKAIVRDWQRRKIMAEQRPTSEPVFCILYEDTEKKPEVFVGEGAKEAARIRYLAAKDNWACHLLSNQPKQFTTEEITKWLESTNMSLSATPFRRHDPTHPLMKPEAMAYMDERDRGMWFGIINFARYIGALKD